MDKIIILLICLILCIGIYFFLKDDKIRKIFLSIYIIWWCIWSIVARSRFGNTYPIKLNVVTIILINIIFFCLAFIVFNNNRNNKILDRMSIIKDKAFKSNTEGCYNIDKIKIGKVFYIIQVLIIGYLSVYVVRYNKLLDVYGVGMARTIKFEVGYLFNSSIESILYSYFIQAVIVIFIVIMCGLISKYKFKNPFIYLQSVIILLYSLIGGGRLIFFEILVYLLISIILINNRSLSSFIKNNYKKIILVSTFIFFIAMIISLKRMNTDFSSINSIINNIERTISQGILYFMGSLKAFNYSISNNLYGPIRESLGTLFPFSIIGGLNQIISFIIPITDINAVVAPVLQSEILIGEYQTFNAFYSGLFNFNLDFGYIGYIICPFVYGSVLSIMLSIFNRNRSIFAFILVVLNLSFALFYEFRWYYQLAYVWVIFFIIIVIYVSLYIKDYVKYKSS